MSYNSVQVVLVTGANQGLGYEVALQLAKLPDYHILVGARNIEKGQAAVNKIQASKDIVSKLEPILVDLDSDETLLAAIKTIETKFGKLDVLVNNAAINLEWAKADVNLREMLATTFSTNVFGTAVLTNAALPVLEKAAFPRVINVSSSLGSLTQMSGDVEPGFRMFGYNTSKTALNALTAHYAYLLKQKKPSSLVLSVCPGFNATSMTDQNSKANSPSHGGAAIVRLVVAGPDSGYKTAEFRDEDGKIKAW